MELLSWTILCCVMLLRYKSSIPTKATLMPDIILNTSDERHDGILGVFRHNGAPLNQNGGAVT